MCILLCIPSVQFRNRLMKRRININIETCEFVAFYARNKGIVIPTFIISPWHSSSNIRHISNVTLHVRPQVVYLDLADKKTIFSDNSKKSGVYR